MLNPLSVHSRPYKRRWLKPVTSFILALSLVVGTPQASQALSWFDIIFRGIQVVQLSNMSDRQEVELGKQINQQIRREVDFYNNDRINRYINEIGQRLVKASTRPEIPYTFQVVDDPSINAFATVGGHVYINKGLITAADNEAQLAGVVAHEIAHITERHALKQMRQMVVAQGVAEAAGVEQSQLIRIGVDLALRLPRSRQHEYEADMLALAMLREAGYAPSGMVEFMKKLKGRSPVPTFLSTHPHPDDRIIAMEQSLDPAQANVGDGLDSSAYKNKISNLL